MPTKDRKYYIRRHNEITESAKKKKDGMELNGSAINTAGDMALHRKG